MSDVDVDSILFRSRMRGTPGVSFAETAEEDIKELCRVAVEADELIKEAEDDRDQALADLEEVKGRVSELESELAVAYLKAKTADEAAQPAVDVSTIAAEPKKRARRKTA